MDPGILQLYGPGMSFYLYQPWAPYAQLVRPSECSSDSTDCFTPTSSAASSATTESATADVARVSSTTSYDEAFAALKTSTMHLERRLMKLAISSKELTRDISKLHRLIASVHHPLLVTWQADILTRLIDVVYSRICPKLPYGVPIGEHRTQNRQLVSSAYVAAVAKIDKATLKKQFRLSTKYFRALQRYEEVVEFRSINPFQTHMQFAQWLVAEKENLANLFAFWAKLFPICHGRSVEEIAGSQPSPVD